MLLSYSSTQTNLLHTPDTLDGTLPAFAIKQAETGTAVAEVCRKMGISEATFYNLEKKYGGQGFIELRRLRQLEAENNKLKQIVTDLTLSQ